MENENEVTDKERRTDCLQWALQFHHDAKPDPAVVIATAKMFENYLNGNKETQQ